jgi:hypothetical protein
MRPARTTKIRKFKTSPYGSRAGGRNLVNRTLTGVRHRAPNILFPAHSPNEARTMATVSLTYAELAERLGVSIDGARMKAKRARWPKAKANDGTVRITVEEDELTPSERAPHIRPEVVEQAAEQVKTLEAHIATLKEQVALMQEQIGKTEARADQERERVADLTSQLLKMTAELLEARKTVERPRSWLGRLFGT